MEETKSGNVLLKGRDEVVRNVTSTEMEVKKVPHDPNRPQKKMTNQSCFCYQAYFKTFIHITRANKYYFF